MRGEVRHVVSFYHLRRDLGRRGARDERDDGRPAPMAARIRPRCRGRSLCHFLLDPWLASSLHGRAKAMTRGQSASEIET